MTSGSKKIPKALIGVLLIVIIAALAFFLRDCDPKKGGEGDQTTPSISAKLKGSQMIKVSIDNNYQCTFEGMRDCDALCKELAENADRKMSIRIDAAATKHKVAEKFILCLKEKGFEDISDVAE